MEKLIVSPSPHRRGPLTTQRIMLMVIIALLPACGASVWIFGARALAVLAVCVISCVVFEFLARKLMKRDNTISDLSAVVTGVLLALNMPVTLPLWLCVIGSFVAIVVVKQLFGGIGQNFANPALVGRIVLLLSAPAAMTNWVKPFWYSANDLTTTATPLNDRMASLSDLFFGKVGGSMGETCALALLIGGIILVLFRVIKPTTPLAFIITLMLLEFVYKINDGIGAATYNALWSVLAGGVMLGAIFMATDYATTPLTDTGKLIFGIGCGALTFLIREFANYPEGVSFAIVLMNILTPYIDKLTMTSPFGAKKEPKKKKEQEAKSNG